MARDPTGSDGDRVTLFELTNRSEETLGKVQVTTESSLINSKSIRAPSLGPGKDNTGDVTAELSSSSGDTGTSDISFTLSVSGSAVSVELRRTVSVTIEAPQSAAKEQLIYAVKTSQSNGDIREYNPATDTVSNPPQSRPASALGDTADIVGDSTVDIPYLTKQGSNRVYATTVGESSDTQIPKQNSTKPKIDPNKPTRIAVGEWQPAGLSGKLILAESNQGNIAGVDANGNAEVIAEPGNGCAAVMGVADIDDDGSDEIIFFDGSQEIRYLNQDGSTEKVPTGGVGSNNGSGIGPPADFDGDGVPRVPFIDGSQNPALTTSDGVITRLNKNGVARKAGVAPVDIDADGDLELLFFGNDEGKLKYVDDVLGSNTIETLKADGSTISPEEKIGLGFGRRS